MSFSKSLFPTWCNSRQSRTAYQAISLILIGALLMKIGYAFSHFGPASYNSYTFTEFLINYEGGFVRRGLIGELLFQLCSGTGASPFPIIKAVCLTAWIACMAFFFIRFHRLGYCWWLLASPFFWGYQAYIIRKDYLCYLLIIGIMYLLKKYPISLRRFLCIIILSTFGLFLHEAFIFFGIPIAALLLIANKSSRRAGIGYSILMCCIFLLLCGFKGNTDIAYAIIESWNSILDEPILQFVHENSIGALSWEAVDTIKFHILKNFKNLSGFGWYGLMIRPLCAICAYYLISNFIFTFSDLSDRMKERLRTNLSALFITTMVCMLPMFTLLSCDYARLYQYVFVTTLAAFIILPQSRISTISPTRFLLIVKRLNNTMNRLVHPTKGLMILLLLFVAPSPFHFWPQHAFTYSIFGTYCEACLSFITKIFLLIHS